MASKQPTYDVWFVQANKVFRQVPFGVITEWLLQGKLTVEDRVSEAGQKNWQAFGQSQQFSLYVPDLAGALAVSEAAESARKSGNAPPAPPEPPLQPPDEAWPRHHDDDDDEVDMIPLIDISLVLLVFFMMTAKVAPVARVNVPDTQNISITANAKGSYWIGVEKGPGDTPLYAISRDGKEPKAGDERLDSQAKLFAKFDELLRRETKPVQVHIAMHRDLPCELVEQLAYELEARKVQGVPIETLLAEVNQKSP
ncbi:ExbD/TolR family protein [Tuwongella immobilis]|uniref:Biopolymer transporter ExbD n=1 Tax=Tuwongella immobilis TaxID=692036 RepID=A0A6C2YSQ2_9BACT|nr:biopolymer transporter ExbD [Tuwongella immobilis]VIP04173.1 biopolymer transporter : Biopolymer transport exbD2 protein OS=Rhodopirellula sallentina SM41 GN=RSSM_04346 PE=3 SV=1: ExbD [Tuwongella immobilis]VTS05711.1 biopolymer transporter : Biopolymer transport exbD2 protein OS=Rhodopirellula sallentina SM41 GN=RSSM_04346 PE=3 SV=1: ExbD [Tuwongella immobilis]